MIVNSIDPIGVDVTTTEVEDPESGAAQAEIFGEREHVLSGTAEPIQGGDQHRIPVLHGPKRPVELWPRGTRSGDTVVDAQVVLSDPCR